MALVAEIDEGHQPWLDLGQRDKVVRLVYEQEDAVTFSAKMEQRV